MKIAIPLEQIKEACNQYLFHIAIRASRGARPKNQIVKDYYTQNIRNLSKIVHYPDDITSLYVRIVTPDNKFSYTRFGCFFFVEDQMYIISEEEKYAQFHAPEVHKKNEHLEVLDDSRTYTIPVIFAGIYTGFDDEKGERIYTGDIITNGTYVAGVDIVMGDFHHIYDNVSVPISNIQSAVRITTVFYDLRINNAEVDIRHRCNIVAQYRGNKCEFIDFIKNHQLYMEMPSSYTINTYVNNKDNSARFALGYNNTNPLFVIGVNPSTADDTKPDQTIRRVIGYAKRNGFNGFVMLNLYAQRANPTDLHSESGFDISLHKQNLECIESCIKSIPNATVLVAFGNTITSRKYLSRCFSDIVDTILPYSVKLKTIGHLTQSGHPRHPSRGAYTELRDLCTQSYLYGLCTD